MTIDKATTKVFFGLLIFMFSLALAYFTASYLRGENLFDYWGALAISGLIYIVVGIIVYAIFPISLGFLFSADILILHLLLENFGDISDIAKTIILGIILIALYGFAWTKMKDESALEPQSQGPLPQGPPPSTQN